MLEETSGQKHKHKAAVALITAALVLSFIPLAATTRGANAATAPSGIMIPLYGYPTDGSWATVVQAKEAYPNVPFIAVINPGSGPGAAQDPNFVAGIASLQAAGVLVLGYVPTGYATSSYSGISGVEAQVSAYSSWYHVNGIFFDEMSNVAGFESYYSTLNAYAKSLGMTYTVGNPGAMVPISYIGTLDTLIIYESGGLPSLPALAYSGYGTNNFAVVSYGAAAPSQAYVTESSNYAAWVYFTDGNLPNPYATLPSYFTEEVAMLSAAAPAPATSTTTSTAPLKSYNITVYSTDLNGSPISGLWTTVESNGSLVASGFTPLSFPAALGASYKVCVANYSNYVFDHWADGSRSACVTISPARDTALTSL
ncbi:MAG TPA: spherulation-specific family 4 protein, partial [Nitrososphaerales archaeon]|nr:spherulation-specific family 4 protein [Nitrososphaerales archaeon]